ncbi:MAG: transglutaminase-like domain-containing protein [Bacillota bacterium]|nr:transglutaminase-like domain-containing protein [Bacillota bacterium]
MEDYLESTELINHHDPKIRRQASDLTAGRPTREEKVRALAEFVREHIILEIERQPLAHRASQVLCFRRGSATGKALLFAALCRASGIPCRIRRQRLTGAPPSWLKLKGAARLEWGEAHPVNEVLVESGWVAVDVSLDSQSASRLGLQMPYITGSQDATLREATVWNGGTRLLVQEESGVGGNSA